MKLNEQAQIGTDPDRMRVALQDHIQTMAREVNRLKAGYFAAKLNTNTAAPTTGTWAVGDFVANSAPAEAGGAGAKYVIEGWQCLVGGTPGTWVAKRYLTGN